MAAITHLYDVDQRVWLLDPSTGLKESVILDIVGTKSLTGTTVRYTIKNVDTNTQTNVEEPSLYATLSGVGSALEAYEALLLA